jgi:hypothetical protein
MSMQSLEEQRKVVEDAKALEAELANGAGVAWPSYDLGQLARIMELDGAVSSALESPLDVLH